MTVTIKKKEFITVVPYSKTSSSATAERPRELGDFKGVCQFDAKF